MNPPPFEYGKIFRIFNRGNNCEHLFKVHEDYALFLRLMEKFLPPLCHIYAFSLLPDQFHLLLQFKEPKELPYHYQIGRKKIHRPFIQLFTSYVMLFNHRYKRSGSLFQEHLHRKEITSEEEFRSVLLNIHLKPATHLNYPAITRYPYASYRLYLDANRTSKIEKSFPLQLFADLENFIYHHRLAHRLMLEQGSEFEYLQQSLE
ncbi:MAG: hypothetical protein R6U66_13875 [Bacteroidales bacterium]